MTTTGTPHTPHPTRTAHPPRTALTLAATLLTATVALYIALVALGNITDFDSNQQFVRHVLAMDTTFKDDDLMWRAITSKGLADAAYVAIIAWETVAALVLVAGTWLWARRDLERARRVSTYGLLMLMLLFGAGFIAIGGEWFAMWQSEDWNGLEAATRVFLLSGVVLLVLHLPDTARAAAAEEPKAGAQESGAPE
ncbi:DUF2165 domain-containing protein [Streptomyces sp. ME02-8801-2C]|uniref:DUF2165 domain-containing protein n=1 Tax=Streptomyces sp. ME02-8801-2C TaxID=3028680 RepID=UPI0029B2E9BF|nr:DUF2165 domain-containing protein [Streptomyces sp. ME02-8801-2C]MDX3455720.1 DUF2165 domain-containing protein [Streptomyces sp. ME02-8801-2C]